MKQAIFETIHRYAGRSGAVVWFARKTKNQANAILRASLNDGIRQDCNGELELMKRIAPTARVVFDVGANTGVWLKAFLLLSSSDCVVHAVEPVPTTLELLRANCTGSISERVVIHECALGDVTGDACIYAQLDGGECSSFVSQHAQGQPVVVAVRRFDELWRVLGRPNVDVLKIDAEGFDLHVLRGASEALQTGAVRVIQFEYNAPWARAGSTLGAALDYLHRFGFDTFLLRQHGLMEFDYNLYGEFFGYSNFVAVARDCGAIRPGPWQ